MIKRKTRGLHGSRVLLPIKKCVIIQLVQAKGGNAMFKRKSKASKKAEVVDTLVIVGNGFDIWQGLDTDYGQFENYYFANRDRILRRLELKKSCSPVQNGVTTATFSDAEIVYGARLIPESWNLAFGIRLKTHSTR